jgi:hypothetical protein
VLAGELLTFRNIRKRHVTNVICNKVRDVLDSYSL